MSHRSRSWVFTINNYTRDDVDILTGIDCQYLVYGIERGQSGTPHLQGFIHFTNAKTRSAVSSLVPRAFLAIRRGTVEQAISYCKKDGIFQERGTRPQDREEQSSHAREKANEENRKIIEKARLGDFEWIVYNHPKLWISRSQSLRSMHKPEKAIIQGLLDNEWWYGTTGTGKSKTVWEEYPNHFQKQTNKWWDGYDGETVVVIEEWSPKNDVSGANLKIWADRYPFPGQIKGGTLQRIRPRKIIVLSNYSIQECFTDSQDRDPILRRFTAIKFPEELTYAQIRAAGFHNEEKKRQLEESVQLIPDVRVEELNSSETNQVDEGTTVTVSDAVTPSSNTIIDDDMLAFLNNLVE